MLSLAFPCKRWSDAMRQVVAVAIPFTFLCTMVNTFLAARGFSSRKKSLDKWLQFILDPDFSSEACRKAIAEHASGWPRLYEPPGETPHFQSREKKLHHLDIGVHWGFVPVPYRVGVKSRQVKFDLHEYVDLIAQECRAARFMAGRLATALGGVTIFLIQMFARL